MTTPTATRTLTVRQPWAWAIARGHKDIENRSWTTRYRGPIAIHAAKHWDTDREATLRAVVYQIREQGGALPATLDDDLPYSDTGLIIATVNLVGICTASLDGDTCDCGPWAMPGHAHWRLENAQVYPEPTPATGRLGLWEFPAAGTEGATS
jgi:hypothetical protein